MTDTIDKALDVVDISLWLDNTPYNMEQAIKLKALIESQRLALIEKDREISELLDINKRYEKEFERMPEIEQLQSRVKELEGNRVKTESYVYDDARKNKTCGTHPRGSSD